MSATRFPLTMPGYGSSVGRHRVIHTVPAISEESSGPSYSVVRLCESIRAHGHDIELAVLEWGPLHSSQPYVRTFPLGLGPRRLGRSPEMKRWLSEVAAGRSVDLIHNHSLWMMPNVYPGQVARKYGLPLVVSPRGTVSSWALASGSRIKRILWPLIQQPALEATTCFHATALSEYEEIRALGFRQPVAIIPNGIDIPAAQSKPSSGPRTLLFLGRIHQKKGLDLLLPAWKALQNRFPEWQLQVIGPDNGGYLEEVRKLARELRLERAHFPGALHGDAKRLAYANAELFVLPTYSENFGMSVAEALAAGTPAIVSKGAPWAGLRDHQAGWWIDIGVDALIAALETALAISSEELQQMGARGCAWMADEFSWDHIGWQMAESYRWLLEGGARPEWVMAD